MGSHQGGGGGDMGSFVVSARASSLGLLAVAAAALPVRLFGATSMTASATSDTLRTILFTVVRAPSSPILARSTMAASLLQRGCVFGYLAVGLDDDDGGGLIRRVGPARLHDATVASAWLSVWAWGVSW